MQAAMRNSKDEENILHMGRNHRYTRTRSITKYPLFRPHSKETKKA